MEFIKMLEVKAWVDYPIVDADKVYSVTTNGTTFYFVTIVGFDDDKYVTVHYQTGKNSFTEDQVKLGYVFKRLPEYEDVPNLYGHWPPRVKHLRFGYKELQLRLNLWKILTTVFG